MFTMTVFPKLFYESEKRSAYHERGNVPMQTSDGKSTRSKVGSKLGNGTPHKLSKDNIHKTLQSY